MPASAVNHRVDTVRELLSSNSCILSYNQLDSCSTTRLVVMAVALQLPNPAARRLGHRIKHAREQARPADGSTPTQRWLAHQFEPARTAQQISLFENGVQLPGLSVLNELYQSLRNDRVHAAPDPGELSQWLTDWLLARAEHDVRDKPEIFNQALDSLLCPPRDDARKTNKTPLGSLANFPGNDPLTIILGDRREPRAQSAADCLIYSGSMTDAMHVSYLGKTMQHSVIRSDKLLVRMPLDYLEAMPELAESNLLIVGSPAVNWGARILNKNDAIFPFRIDDDVVARDEQFRLDPRMQDETFANLFWNIAQSLNSDGATKNIGDDSDQRLFGRAEELARKVLDGSTAKALMNKFRTLGIIDPADQEHHAQITHGSNDFSVVTLARNPYCKTGRYRAVICGGIHGPGTARALKELLSQPERFRHHPLGAVLEVNLRRDLDWPTRFEKASVSFQTREYVAEDVLENLDAACRVDQTARSPAFRLLAYEALESRAAFVREVING